MEEKRGVQIHFLTRVLGHEAVSLAWDMMHIILLPDDMYSACTYNYMYSGRPKGPENRDVN